MSTVSPSAGKQVEQHAQNAQHARQNSKSSSLHPSAGLKPPSPSRRPGLANALDENNPLIAGESSSYGTVLRARARSTSSQPTSKTPARSFYHRTFHGQFEPAQYSSSVGTRDETAELASLAVSDHASFPDDTQSISSQVSDEDIPAAIAEVSEPVTPEDEHQPQLGDPSVSNLTMLIQNSTAEDGSRASISDVADSFELNEQAALLTDRKPSVAYSLPDDIEGQRPRRRSGLKQNWDTTVLSKARSCLHVLCHPKSWSARAVYQEAVVHPVKLLPAVFLGLLLNVLDALSYGMILFPLGSAVFDGLGSDGVAMYYVTTIVAQVVYSSGGSIFRGGIGSEMIEVVPFFHKMAFTILAKVGEDHPKSVLATTVLAFSASSVMTGLVFFLMGAFKVGTIIDFFPRHILIGCIGGVGWFLVATGFDVSARLSGNLQYNLDTLKHLFRSDTVLLWAVPLGLAITLNIIQRFVKSNLLVGGYFMTVAAIFYLAKFALGIPMDVLHSEGWVFDPPPAGNPWYHFYSFYDLKAVHWGAFADTIPAMLALTFFGVLHVPINVPALAMSTGEDDVNVDRELVAHGISNCLSGFLGSVQNYLAYTNSLLFVESGGNDRFAGLLLAAATGGVLVAGPAVIGYIPIMVVGALIFLLGIDLLREALVGTWGKVHRLEYATIVVIIVVMGVWDFVVGILVGIILAALSFVLQTSSRTAIRATYSGQIAKSTVRRPPTQVRFLKETGEQIMVLKLSGFLFFGTIVGVENRIRALLAEEAFRSRPMQFLVLDMHQISGIDYSAAEAFTRINRLLQKRGVVLVISNLDVEGDIGKALVNVGLFEPGTDVELFPDLNVALEHCENKLLATLYRQQEYRHTKRIAAQQHDVRRRSSVVSQSYRGNSPRRFHLHRAAQTTLDEDTTRNGKWQSFKQPLPLLLQIFSDLSDKNEDFWHRAARYFERVTHRQSAVLFNLGDRASGFYILEEGILRADYETPQGSYSELIVAGRPCGELPFFSETNRTATMVADKDSVTWRLDENKWQEMQSQDPDIARELLKISLKLTKERMEVITSYVLTAAG